MKTLNWVQHVARLFRNLRRTPLRRPRLRSPRSLCAEQLEVRTLLSVSLGANYAGLDFNASGGYVPPDTCGAAGPSSYVETVNQTVALYTSKTASSPVQTAGLDSFFFNTGHLSQVDSGSERSDPIVTYDEKIGRYIVGDQDVDFNTHVSNFLIAVSKSSTPGSLSSADWNFYKISTTESGFDADYPGNFGYNADAFVFTLNMFGVSSGGHALVVSVNASDLANGVAQSSLHTFRNDVNNFDLRPTTMHDSVAGDPMWLVTDTGDNLSIQVYKMTSVLSNSAGFNVTTLQVTPYSNLVNPLNPDGTVITDNIDSRIMKAAEWNNSLVATQAVGVSSTQDVAQWYRINVSSGTPVLADQGRISGGAHTYIFYPGIDINASGQIGMTYMKSGTDSATDFMSMYVTGRTPSDAPGTMETPVLVSAGAGQKNYKDFTSFGSGGGRAGDLSGINVDPIDGSFWAANEFANKESVANWGTAIANFSLGPPPDHFIVTPGVTTTIAGTAFDVTVTALNSDNTVDTSYTGTIHFSSSDIQAVLPFPDYTFTADVDNGTHLFVSGVTLKTAGNQSVVVTDANGGTGFGTETVSPDSDFRIAFGPINTAITPAVTVYIFDQYGNVTTSGANVSITVNSGPSGAALVGTTSTNAVNGVATFNSLTLNTPGLYTLLATSVGLTQPQAISAAFNVGTSTIENFESGNLTLYKVVPNGKPSASVSATAKHDGGFGLLDASGNDWIYRSDAAAKVSQGDTISVWLNFGNRTGATASFGFGASATGTLALVASSNGGGQLQFQKVDFTSNASRGGTVSNVANVRQRWSTNTWYRLEVQWGTNGTIVGNLYSSNGTKLNTIKATASAWNTSIVSGGIAFRASGGSGAQWDTVTDKYAVNAWLSPEEIERYSAPGSHGWPPSDFSSIWAALGSVPPVSIGSFADLISTVGASIFPELGEFGPSVKNKH